MSDHFGHLICVTIFYESFDIFSSFWPLISSTDEFGGCCRSAMFHLWGFVVFGDKIGSYPFFFGTQIFPWYHKRPSFHWHSPNAIPFISFLPLSKFLLMSWISSSTLLAFCISPSSLSRNSVVSNMSSLTSSVSGISHIVPLKVRFQHLG